MAHSEKEELVETLGVHFENLHTLPPLAARLYATLLLEGAAGLPFDTLLERTCASKSSVSTSISLLLQSGMIEYLTRPGERKRYFRKKTNYFKCRLNQYLDLIEKDLILFDRTREYMRDSQTACQLKQTQYLTVYREYLNNTRELIANTLIKLEEAQA